MFNFSFFIYCAKGSKMCCLTFQSGESYCKTISDNSNEKSDLGTVHFDSEQKGV